MTSFRARLAAFYAVVLAGVLCAFAATVWAIIQAEEAKEPPEVAALEPPDQTGQHLLVALGAALLLSVPLAIGGAILVARRGLRPLDDIVETAARIDTERLGERIALRPDAPAELVRLGESVNAMLARLDHSVAGMRRFTADASHELRTPLAALIGELELTLRRPRSEAELRGAIETSLEQLGRLSRLVESLLTLAQSDASALPITATDLELVDAVRRIGGPYEAVLATRGVRLAWDLCCELRARTDSLFVGRVVANLLDNACRYCPDGGVVTIRVAALDGQPVIEVHNTGAYIPDAERIFERFYRGQDARAHGEGFGLGLPLARDIARALGGELRIIPDETGARFVLTLPAPG